MVVVVVVDVVAVVIVVSSGEVLFRYLRGVVERFIEVESVNGR